MNTLRKSIITAVLLQSCRAFAGELIDESRDVNADAIIDVEIMNGVVTLTGWDQNRFHIAGELSDASEGYDLREVAGGVRFEEHIDRRSSNNCWARGNRCGASTQSDLDIRLPRNSVLRFGGINIEVTVEGLYGATDIELVNGDVYATDLRGTVKLQTVNGDIDGNDLDGRVSLETVNGSIDADGTQGARLSLNTVNGDIDVKTGSARVDAETTNGDIEIEAGAVDELEISTVGGRVDAIAGLNDDGEININSFSGRIELALPTATSARFNIQTATNGRITNELSSDEAERRNRYGNSRELDFTLNAGTGDVSISTVTGDITLRGR